MPLKQHYVTLPLSVLAFWSWFELNSFRLLASNGQDEALSTEVITQLSKIAPGLTFEIGGQPGKPPREFTISADGQRDLFPVVKRLVASAPTMHGWIFHAFRQPSGTNFQIRLGKHLLRGEDLWCSVQHHDQLVDIHMFAPGILPENEQQIIRAGFMLLDTALGEYTMEMMVANIAWHPLPANPTDYDLFPFHELPRRVSGWVMSA